MPSHIYIQLVTPESSSLDQLTKDMTEYYNGLDQHRLDPLTALEGVGIGNVYCAPFEFDDQWYRACVLEIDSVEKTASVYYIDFGDSGSLSLEDLKLPK